MGKNKNDSHEFGVLFFQIVTKRGVLGTKSNALPWCLRIRLAGRRKFFNAIGRVEVVNLETMYWGHPLNYRFNNIKTPRTTYSMLGFFVAAVFLFLCSFFGLTIWWLSIFLSVTSIGLRHRCLVSTFVILVRPRELRPVQGSLCKGWFGLFA